MARASPTIQQRTSATIENNFTGGLKTEFTGLNFPENACTSVDNCVFSIIGDVLRREGINFEANNELQSLNCTNEAVSYFRWTNAGGDGLTEVLVVQVGGTLYFFNTSAATAATPVSAQYLSSTVTISMFQVVGSSSPINTVECQYATGNGYLFVFHPACDPFYCIYSAGTITGTTIPVSIRDFIGIVEPGVLDQTRPIALSVEHQYNLQNQGWTSGPIWAAVANNTLFNFTTPGNASFTGVVFSGTPAIGQQFTMTGTIFEPTRTLTASGTVTAFNTSLGTLSVNFATSNYPGGNAAINLTFNAFNAGLITTWQSDIGNYPSNSDVWWEFKDDTDTFNPSTTINNVTLDAGPAPKGYYILSAFNQQRTNTSGIKGLTDVTTTVRPRTGTWFQGRVWYAGVDASQQAVGDAQYYTWTENIYFSQIINNVSQFGYCYETNDPTSENLFDLLPTDGGVIQIQGAGSIYKLFPIQNGMLVFADKGVWFITGSSGIGFAANDYTITKISSVQSISTTSFIEVLGLPMFWNEEGIYAVEPAKGGQAGLAVNPLTVGTILSFYNDIPLDSKRFVRGDYNPLDYTVSWVYRSTEEAGISNRYQFDSVLNLNIYNKAFYPYSISSNLNCFVNGLVYMNYPSGSLNPTFKYLTAVGTNFTLSEENDDVNYVDWFSFDGVGVNYVSNFITGYRIHGQALLKAQPMYVYIYSRNDNNTGYKFNSVWNFATSGDSGKYSTQQVITNAVTNFGMVVRRHRVRGHGWVYQLQVTSVDGMPFDIMGWSTMETISGNV